MPRKRKKKKKSKGTLFTTPDGQKVRYGIQHTYSYVLNSQIVGIKSVHGLFYA